jgi:HPt (histidine-containing phosphotransfer) domain-containing protein
LCNSLPQRAADMRQAVEMNDANQLGRLAHNLKGVALNFNAGPLAAIAVGLEDLSRREDLKDAPPVVAQLLDAQRALKESLKNWSA